jgi:uncharacterized protein (DUF362 family)
MSLVSFVKKDKNELKKAIKLAMDLIDYRFPRNVKNVIIKPNMCYYWDYSTGHTTDPLFVAALVEIIREELSAGVNISIVESDASAMKCKYAFRILGYDKLVETHKVRLVNLSDEKIEESKVIVNGIKFNFKLPEIIRDADLKINIPKPKYMETTTITCSLKNIFGCNPEPLKYKLHSHLNEAIVGINALMKFDLTILDGLIVTGVTPRKLDLVMASQDPVAIDSAVAQMMGVNPKRINHLQLAKKVGLGTITYTPKGDKLEDFQKIYPKKSTGTKILTLGYKIAIRMGMLKAN